ncbi:four helix bundle protein [Halomonas marinisediminis]|uniref:Four helix bundle protein n=1 Tax=Halomonas marinisediminis TaxID=2546095 RepID=A0ABY2D770_9GAMM|nr:four helix bundle protein [Halomonas marinisediminis]TDB02882.1 four helix bundle protein [Halomonas marinisediminis]
MRFEDLEVWKRAARLSTNIYQHFSDSRDFGFKDQITRSSLSIASNIAEGYERIGEKDRIRFLNYAKGSCGELRTQIYIGTQIGYIDRQVGKLWVEETHELSRMLYGLMNHFRKQG